MLRETLKTHSHQKKKSETLSLCRAARRGSALLWQSLCAGAHTMEGGVCRM